ncbi:MAG: hypothetical protein QME13_03185 [Thermoanaerobacteraceae bacterium]|nr:hypothetical protein [Thermoanaerobacteraceae bacterium]
MRLLVTGGAGFIGSNFIRYILTRQPLFASTTLHLLENRSHLLKSKQCRTGCCMSYSVAYVIMIY